jgi:hypothetical protein
MKLFWYPLAFFICCLLCLIMFIGNVPKLVYNAFHKAKKPIYWDPMEEARMNYKERKPMDVTESFYHD